MLSLKIGENLRSCCIKQLRPPLVAISGHVRYFIFPSLVHYWIQLDSEAFTSESNEDRKQERRRKIMVKFNETPFLEKARRLNPSENILTAILNLKK